jgi:peptide/nickel transport system ATP-binding protein
LTIGQQLIRLVRLHSGDRSEEPVKRVLSLLREVELSDTEGVLHLYPHQLSGGMQQRVMIAMALASSPRLLIADEPTTALDVTIQAQILSLLKRLCDDHGIAVLLITHDIGVIEQACSRVAVLYAGKVVEAGSADEILARPKHPYTKALMAALPERAVPQATLSVLRGSVPSGRSPLPPCVFAARCPSAMEVCWVKEPAFVPQTHGEVACWLHAKTQ